MSGRAVRGRGEGILSSPQSAMEIEPLKTLPPLRSGGQSAATQKQRTKKPVSPPFIIVSATAAAFPASPAKIPQSASEVFLRTTRFSTLNISERGRVRRFWERCEGGKQKTPLERE